MPLAWRLKALNRKVGLWEKLLIILLAGWLGVRFAAPASGMRDVLQIAVTAVGLIVAVRLARRGIRRAIWRLRNRLLVAYAFIAVVPVVLILVLVGVGVWLLTGQIAVYLVTAELERQAESLLGPSQGLVYGDRVSRLDRARWVAPYLRERFPGLEMTIRDHGEWRYPETAPAALPPPGWGPSSGVVLKGGRLFLWAHAASPGGAEVTALAPLTRAFLAGLVPNLGEVSIIELADRSLPLNQSGRPETSAPDQRDRVPAPASVADLAVSWFSLVRVSIWDSPGRTVEGLLGVRTRPSAVLRTVFGQRVELAQNILFVFLGVSILFLVVELISLVIGSSMTRTITGAVHNLYEGTQRVMEGDFTHRIEVRGADQLADLSRSFNRMTENLERLLAVEKDKQRLQSELEIAREVQNQLYPKSLPSAESLRLTAFCQPARMVSGDYYDYQNLAGSKVVLAIGDVSGKGISAALLMATVQSSMRTQLRACLEAATHLGQDSWLSTARLVAQLNHQLYAFTPAEKFATFYIGLYDDASGFLTYTNAGHPPPVLLRNGEVRRLDVNGMVVGAFPFSEYDESRIELLPGDLLVFFTDGITEPENEYGEMYGEERLIDTLVRNAAREEPEIIAAVMDSVGQWANSPEPQDDMTLLLARRL